MTWLLLFEILYLLFIIGVCLRIIYDTHTVSKTLGYLLLVIFLPVIGMVIYFSFGINYRKNKLYSKKIIHDKVQEQEVLERTSLYNQQTLEAIKDDNPFQFLFQMIYHADQSPLTSGNSVELLINGEEKFPAVLKAIKEAKHHIHLEYYIFEDDHIGRTLEDLLVQKAKEGVEVRFLYDDFGSASIRKNLVKRLKTSGVEAYPFYKILLLPLANRINYRNHRKIIVIDGYIGFVGGINVSDKYVNNHRENQYFWRDTHLKIVGPATAVLQHIFIADWNFCASKKLQVTSEYFSNFKVKNSNKTVQIVASGPDSDRPSIYYAVVKMIMLAKNEVLLTSPYFIPGETVLDAMVMAALSGVKVKLLVPGLSDSFFVNAAARSYYLTLLKAGVEIYLYQKGFVHAKTMVVDNRLAMVGTANLDYRSFDLNFEVNAIVFDSEIANGLASEIYKDFKQSTKLDLKEWTERPGYIQLFEKTVRLFSPLL